MRSFARLFIFVAPGPAEGCVEGVPVERLLQRFGLHYHRMQRRARGDWVDPSRSSLFVGVDDEIEPELARSCVAKGDHLAELPSGIDMEQRKRQRAGKERFAGQMQQHARIFADRIEHDRVAEFGYDLAHNTDRFGFEALQMSGQETAGDSWAADRWAGDRQRGSLARALITISEFTPMKSQPEPSPPRIEAPTVATHVPFELTFPRKSGHRAAVGAGDSST
jgi:hypothetical protein